MNKEKMDSICRGIGTTFVGAVMASLAICIFALAISLVPEKEVRLDLVSMELQDLLQFLLSFCLQIQFL